MSKPPRFCITCIFVLLQIYSSAQDKIENYISGVIPDSLKREADVVCRLDEHVVEIKSPGRAIVSERHIYTILNENGNDWSDYSTFYDKFSVINNVTGTLFDQRGREIQHFKKKDMQDLPMNDGSSFVNDERIKKSGFVNHAYPYSVSFEEEDEITDLIQLPRWRIPRPVRTSVLFSRYILIAPKNYTIRYKVINASIAPVITEKNDRVTYTWEIKNLPAIEEEPYAVTSDEYNPFMLVAPSLFEVEGYHGNMSEWNNYAKFYYDLQKGRDVLPENLKQTLHALTDHITDTAKKVALIYDYLQKNTHYVGIQLGIGGFQTFEASYVAKNKYGDCKALSNFMVSMLKEIGIRAHSVIIYGGTYQPPFVKDFPSHQFNHAICCVPLNKDTIWLECTSQSLPAGYLSSFTANRYGLLVNENGGQLVHTPAYLLKDNNRLRNVSASLDTEGNLNFHANTSYQGICQDPVDEMIHSFSKDEQLIKLKSKFDLPTYNVSSFSYTEDNTRRLPVIHENLDVTVGNYAAVSGKRIFINPNILSRSAIVFPENKERILDIKFVEEYRYIDSIRISLPSGYEIEMRPEDISLDTKFGKYSSRVSISSGSIVLYRSLDQYSGRFPVNEYAAVKKYYDEIFEADRAKIVLVKKN